MTREELLNEIELKHGEVLEMVPPHLRNGVTLNILVHMVIEARNLNDYYKRRLEACQR